MRGFLFRHRRFLWRHRDVVLPIGMFLLRRRARAGARRLTLALLALSGVGALGAFAWWWCRRDRGGGDDPWRAPEPAPEPPPPAPEPVDPVAA